MRLIQADAMHVVQRLCGKRNGRLIGLADWIPSSAVVWTVSSAKPGNGIAEIRDGSSDTYWQSDGHLPHYINIEFQRKVRCLWTFDASGRTVAAYAVCPGHMARLGRQTPAGVVAGPRSLRFQLEAVTGPAKSPGPAPRGGTAETRPARGDRHYLGSQALQGCGT